jgi:RNA polymerase-binding transcription factor DksA
VAKKVKKTTKKASPKKAAAKTKAKPRKAAKKKSVANKAARKKTATRKKAKKAVKKKTAVSKAKKKATKKNTKKKTAAKKKTNRKTRTRASRTARLTREEIAGFRMLLLEKRAELVGDVNYIENEALRKSRGEAAGDLSSMPIHMADIGTDNFEQEFSLGLMDSERKILLEITAALGRIDEGKFGICEGTGQPISKARLRANPWARYCIKYATMVEQGLVIEGERIYDEETDAQRQDLSGEMGEFEIVDEPDGPGQHDLEDTHYGALNAHDDD